MNGVCYLKRHDLSFRRTSCSSWEVCGFLSWRS
jgi:hypothetical protein